MIDAVRYVADNGVKWASLPADFPRRRWAAASDTWWWTASALASVWSWL
ncbi:hypothetical protein AB5J49_41595 [Streptomyces sp. R28]|uniref:Transposase n=1 Tax=Streptomyces sp. R28 TaxID=3238628 RepID=A0AB39QEV2_9ACTN